MIKVRLFASLKDIVGSSEMELPSSHTRNPKEIFDQLAARFPELARYRPVVLIAVNQQYSSWEESLKEGDEVAFFPPVSGGAR